MPGTIHVGASGYSYPHWREVFYPRGLAQTRWLDPYATVSRAGGLNAGHAGQTLPSSRAIMRGGSSRGR